MKEYPILFSSPMVRAVMAGKKTQTRRVIKPQPECVKFESRLLRICRHCPYGAPGDHLWVRETWALRAIGPDVQVVYYADNESGSDGTGWKPSIHMPRAYSRLDLRVTDVRVERVQDISEEDASAEGVDYYSRAPMTARERFPILWDVINATRGYGWDKNPWVWVIEFEVIPW